MKETIITSILSNSISLCAVGFLCKSIISRFLQHDIEAHKARLSAENLKLQISYGGIFEKQATALIELYDQINTLENLAVEILYHGDMNKKFNDFRDETKAFRKKYQTARILLPKSLDKKLTCFIHEIPKEVFTFTRMENKSDLSVDEEKKYKDAANFITKGIPALKNDIIEESRRILSTSLSPTA